MRFDEYYCSDAPCLPSRAALFSGRFGIHNGISNHGGTAADMRLLGRERGMRDDRMEQECTQFLSALSQNVTLHSGLMRVFTK